MRDRLLAAADELFYAEGIHTVGIDRVLERAQVAKASLYSSFGSKEELVRAYLEARAERRRQRILQRIQAESNPRARILAVYDVLADFVREPTYRGCAFINARAEGPREDNKLSPVCSDSRRWLQATFVALAREYGAADAQRLGRRLAMLYDAATVGASMDGDANAVAEARQLATELLDAARPDQARSTPQRAARRRRSAARA